MRRFLLPLTMMLLLVVANTAVAQNTTDLYTSASGWVRWGNIPTSYTAEGGITYDFEAEVATGTLGEGWSTIDADQEGLAPGIYADWTIPTNGNVVGRNGTAGVIYSESYYCNGSTWNQYGFELNPDNWLITPQTTITQQNKIFSFWAAATDNVHFAEHFGVAVSTGSNTNTAFFEMKEEWTCTDAEWHKYSIDLSNYVGQQIYVAIRHFNCTDQFRLRIDDICFGGTETYELQNASLLIDGNMIAENIEGHDFLFDADAFADGSSHTTTLRMVYTGNHVVEETYDWTYQSGNHFIGANYGLHLTFDGTRVNLSWNLPQMPTVTEDLFYDFEDGSLGDLYTLDADGDGYNWQISEEGHGINSMFCAMSWTYAAGGQIDPDDYLFTRKLTPSNNSVISFDAAAYSNDYDDEVYGVAISTDGINFTTIQTWTAYNLDDDDEGKKGESKYGTTQHRECSLSAYAGQEIYVAIRHYESGINDATALVVDNILITNVTRNPIAKGALVYRNDELIAILDQYQTSYTDYPYRDNDLEYCIRIIQDGPKTNGHYYALAAPQCATAELTCFAPYDLQGIAYPESNNISLVWEPSIAPITIVGGEPEDFYEDWARIDGDGDGQGWLVWNYGGMDENGAINTDGSNLCFVSSSYDFTNNAPRDPNNFLIMPKLTVGTGNPQLVFHTASYDAGTIHEYLSIGISSTNNTYADAFDLIADIATEHQYQKYIIDLSAYAGQDIYIAFNHFGHEEGYAIVLDNITVVGAVWQGQSLDGLSLYHIERSTDGENYTEIATTQGLTYVDEGLTDGTYWYRVWADNTLSDGSECQSDYAWDLGHNKKYVVIDADGVTETELETRIYPNPTKGIINIEAEGMTRFSITNTLGQVVYEKEAHNSATIDMNRFSSGMYLLSITTDNGIVVKRVNVIK